MKVKALKAHGNPHGRSFWKEPKTVYELSEREASGLIAAGLVEAAPVTKPRVKRPNKPASARESLQG